MLRNRKAVLPLVVAGVGDAVQPSPSWQPVIGPPQHHPADLPGEALGSSPVPHHHTLSRAVGQRLPPRHGRGCSLMADQDSTFFSMQVSGYPFSETSSARPTSTTRGWLRKPAPRPTPTNDPTAPLPAADPRRILPTVSRTSRARNKYPNSYTPSPRDDAS
jgi:hypothetical protein